MRTTSPHEEDQERRAPGQLVQSRPRDLVFLPLLENVISTATTRMKKGDADLTDEGGDDGLGPGPGQER